ncbi:MAG: GNAT family N-acetyltransferase [Chloroflexi bacterium]|nr:GNAT family N-acetyltransferase [Chloroflexota bacterium]
MPALLIRDLTHKDLPALEWGGRYTHYRRVFRQTFDEARAGRRLMLVAEMGREIVGQVFVQLRSTEPEFADGARRGYLYALRVKPDHQGQGIGSQLMAAAEARLRALGFSTAIIAVAKTNEAARRIYEGWGYAVIREDAGRWSYVDHRGQRRDMREPCWVLEKQLSPDRAAR